MQRSEARRWGQIKPCRAGQLIRELREQAGMSPKDLCRKTGMHVSQLSDVERGIQPLSLRRAHQIATTLGVTFDDVLTLILQDRLEDAGFSNLTVHVSVTPPDVDETQEK